MEKGINLADLVPIKQNSKGLLFSINDVNKYIANEMKMDSGHLTRRANNMSKDLENAKKVMDEFNNTLDYSIQNLIRKHEEISEKTKRVSGNVRKSTHELGSGLLAIEKMANFDKLERYVLLLERTASALTTLSELDKAGKLEKIFSVVKN